ncbi:NACHT domain-containing NTPase [Nocardia sp. NRRL S-836]|uniref:NACHT domain-containing protein n=1 Tax=Nocardia sp. NRRL S-836 TaxID=1519492 RepID=UPI0009E9B648|nr:NACHT domain-containing protein [Nocardia sp. NRRL S-836]
MPPKPPSQEDDRIFEDEVRRFARLLYHGNEGRGAEIFDERERDGIFVTEDLAVAIEATRSTSKDKAKQDGSKLRELVTKLDRRHPDKAVRGFFITEQEPTAHQREAISKMGQQVSAMSFATYQAKLIDARMYVNDRKSYQFGSALDPFTQKADIQGKYIPIGLVELPDKIQSHTVQQVRESLDSGRQVVLLGEFGAGKSMTMREIFLDISRDLLSSRRRTFAIYLNLRDHQGQSEPAEALHRHAQKVGFPHPHQLVRAWRSGRAIIMLDGFDEISALNWPGRIDSLASFRRRSVALVRNFVAETPVGTGIMLAGRQHFFDDNDEMYRCLGLKSGSTMLLSASDLTAAQVRQLIASRGEGAEFPAWLPPRPLLVAHLASRELLADLGRATSGVDAAEGWDFLIDVISEREARGAGNEIDVDGASVRVMLERLASLARSTPSGLGPFSFDDVFGAFKAVCSTVPDTESIVLLQRLACLQVYEPATNSRSFVDDDLADALRAGDIIRFIESPFIDKHIHLSNIQTLVGDLGISVIAHISKTHGTSVGAIRIALQRAIVQGDRMRAVAGDIMRLYMHIDESIDVDVELDSLIFPSFTISETASAANVTLKDCLIQELDISGATDVTRLPTMKGCVIEMVTGVAGIDNLARDRFEDCSIESFTDSVENAAAILSLPVSDWRRVTLSILQRLFLRSGKGRRELAFYRGGLTEAQKALVPKILDRVQSEGIAWRGRNHGTVLWSPNRAMGDRVRKILAAPSMSDDPLLNEHPR